MDSRVAIGAAVKRRSPSRKLNAVLRGMLPWILAGDLYVGLHHVCTRANMADDPSRDAPLGPRIRQMVPWI
eukprot:5989899-Heterocapsa_arctica.AAC.1